MKIRNLGQRASARGLTLIELVVVLAILVALAGLIIGNFPSLLKKASGSTAANTIQDISRAMSIRYTTKGSYASGFDALANAFLPTNSLGQVTAGTGANTQDVAPLNKLGLNDVVNLLAYPSVAPDATWSVSQSSNVVALTAGTQLTKVDTSTTAGAALFNKLVPNTAGLVAPEVYLFGVGKVSTLVGADSTLLEAPTRTGVSEFDNSATYYQRYCVAFLVDGVASKRVARFLGTAAPTVNGFEITDDQTALYNEK